MFGQSNAEMDQLRIIDEEGMHTAIKGVHQKHKTHNEAILMTTSAKELPTASKFLKNKNSI
jgi:hypothetical protein